MRHAVRNQHTHNFFHGYVTEVFGDDEVDHVVDIRQPVTSQCVDRHSAGKLFCLNVFTRSPNVFRAGIQTMNQITVVDTQFSGQSSIAATQMNDAATISVADSAPAGPTHKMYATAMCTETKTCIVCFMFCNPLRFVSKILILFHADYFTVFQRDVQPFIVLTL